MQLNLRLQPPSSTSATSLAPDNALAASLARLSLSSDAASFETNALPPHWTVCILSTSSDGTALVRGV